MEAIITLQAVTKVYRKTHLGRVTRTTGVEALDLSIAKGEVFGLLGLNGAGKTTTIKLMLGLLYPTKGSITMLGSQMPNMAVLGRVGYLPEAAYLNKYLTGEETLSLFKQISQLQAESRATVKEYLAMVGMTRFAKRRLAQYSKGMLQRISIAQALLHDPDILIFDEPITGLDPLALKEVRQLIVWLKGKGKTVFFSSHNISEVERVCDRIGIMVSGRLERLIHHHEWTQNAKSLEAQFVEAVQHSDSVGPLSFMSM